jgi:glucuronate isomerase
MQKFMNEDFLLKTETAKHLFHDYAAKLPIFDYHCHINPKEIWENKSYENITQVWLYGDHYKWRIMRAVGIEEKYITGDSTDYEKFLAYAKALSYAIGNPLYHWSHLELKNYFGIEETLSEKTAPIIWEKANAALKDLPCRKLIEMSNVALIGTTDDPIDSLEYHKLIREEGAMKTKVVPSFRPDKAVDPARADFAEYMGKLGAVCGINIQTVADLKAALANRIDFFHENGSRVSDHALDYVPFVVGTEAEINTILAKALLSQTITTTERDMFRTHIIKFLAAEYNKRNWVQQWHLASIRDNNKRLYKNLGVDVGNDAIMDVHLAKNLAALLNACAEDDQLPKTILYSLNPNDNYTLMTVGGCFQGGGIPGKIQLGSAWWFNDHIDGMVDQMRAVANVGVLGKFIGMLTDSRSYLSYFRHEYFRRIACNLIGNWVEDGEYPNDEEMLKTLVEGICFNNAVEYFGIEL